MSQHSLEHFFQAFHQTHCKLVSTHPSLANLLLLLGTIREKIKAKTKLITHYTQDSHGSAMFLSQRTELHTILFQRIVG